MESILTSIKKLLGIEEDYEIFDTDIVIYINSAFATLTQLGVGPVEGFSISDKTATWSSYMQNDPRLEHVKTYIYLKGYLIHHLQVLLLMLIIVIFKKWNGD